MRSIARPRVLAIALVVLFTLALSSQGQAQVPTIAANGIRNGASYALPGMPNAGIAQGSIFVIFGDNMGPAALVQVSQFPLPTSQGLAGTSVKITVGSTTVDAIMLYTLKTQVAAVVPSNTPIGAATARVTYNGQTSAPASFNVVARSFGVFALNQAGSGPGVVQNFNSQTDQPFNGATRAANPQQVEILWGTGIGGVAGNEAGSALPGNMPNVNLHVFVGNQEAQVQYRGRSGCCVGIDQIVFTVPSGITGCAVPVYITVDGVVSNFVSISIAATGNTCSDPGGYSDSDISLATANGGLRVASLAVQRYFSRVTNPFVNPRLDSISASYARVPLETILNAQGAPAVGSCTVLPIPAPIPPAPGPLNAGTLSVSGPVGNRMLAMTAPGSYFVGFSPGGQFLPSYYVTDGTVVTAGTYNITATAGSDVGAHNVSIDHSATFQWTQFETISTNISRSQGLPVSWTGASGGYVIIEGYSIASIVGNTAIGAYFYCYADAAAGSFTVPASILSALPVSTQQFGVGQGSLVVIYFKPANLPNAPGVDRTYGGAYDGYDISPVNYQ